MNNKEVLAHIQDGDFGQNEQIVYKDGTTYFPKSNKWYRWEIDLKKAQLRVITDDGVNSGSFNKPIYDAVCKALKNEAELIMLEDT